MTSKAPPVPPDNRSKEGSGDDKTAPVDQAPRGKSETRDPDKIGQTGNIKQNTTNQGYQQDR